MLGVFGDAMPMVFSLLLSTSTGNDDAVNLTLAPNPMSMSISQLSLNLTVTCSSRASNLTRIILFRRTAFSNFQILEPLASGNIGIHDGTVVSNLTSVIAAGIVRLKFARVTILSASCRDSGDYFCRMKFLSSNSSIANQTVCQTFVVGVTPGNVEISATPDLDVYVPGTTLLLNCSTALESRDKGSEVRFLWDYKAESGEWLEEEIDVGSIKTVAPIKAPCYNLKSSLLNRTLTAADMGRIFRCYVQHGNQTYLHLAANFSIDPGLENQSYQPLLSDSKARTSGSGLSSGAVASITVAGVILLSGIALMIRRRRQIRRWNKSMEAKAEVYDLDAPWMSLFERKERIAFRKKLVAQFGKRGTRSPSRSQTFSDVSSKNYREEMRRVISLPDLTPESSCLLEKDELFNISRSNSSKI